MTVIRYSGWYSPELCRQFPDHLFVFGDNTIGIGKGGQAIIRDEPNAIGVPTKYLPSMTEESFFYEGDSKALMKVLDGLKLLWLALKDGRDVIIPVTKEGEVSLGLERARLKEFAPSIYATIVKHVEEMGQSYGYEVAAEPSQIFSYYTN